MREHLALERSVYETDRPLHHALALKSYATRFERQNLTPEYQKRELELLDKVFQNVNIADPLLLTVRRPVDTFDLCDPHLASRVIEACERDLPTKPTIRACLKAIDRYCRFLAEVCTLHIEGQSSLYLPDLYGPIQSPINRYSLPRQARDKPNRNYLEDSEYKAWLRFTWNQIDPQLPSHALKKVCHLHLMCVLAGETGLRLQELLGLRVQHVNLVDRVCLVTWGKRTRGSAYRKRQVPLTDLAIATVQDFLKQYPHKPDQFLIQNSQGERLSKNTAHHWMDELIKKLKQSKEPILIDKGFGWHGFRRTYARRFLAQGGNIFDLKAIAGWTYTSTISHYLGDSKRTEPNPKPPLIFKRKAVAA